MYAVVQDVPASWADYEKLAGITGAAPPGLILHVAGPTDEGFRTIELWESRESCDRFQTQLTPEHWRRHGCLALPTRRTLFTATTVQGNHADGTFVPTVEEARVGAEESTPVTYRKESPCVPRSAS